MTIIGKIKEVYKDNSLLSIKELIQENPIEGKEQILKYLRNGKKGAYAPSKMIDVISGEVIPGELCCYSDGEYGWRSDTIYYFEKYNLKLEEEFIKSLKERGFYSVC